MLPVYFGAFVFGGVLLGASLLGGGDGHSAAHDGDGHGTDGHAHGSHETGLWPLLSVRFWLFAVTFFGLTGAIATLAGAAGLAVPLAATGVGLVSGYGAARAIGSLARRPVGLVASASAHVGREGRLLLPVGKDQRGKLRVVINGVTTDLLAETDGDHALPAGASALIVGIRGNVAIVEGLERSLPEKETP